MTLATKICGLTNIQAVQTACSAGADYIGFVFYEKSVRHLNLEKAAAIASVVDSKTKRIAVVVDPNDEQLQKIMEIVPIEGIQLHGQESPERVGQIRNQTGLTIIKAISINIKEDVKKAHLYEKAADMLLFDGKPPVNSIPPGGNAIAFDWDLLDKEVWSCPWFLSGGMTAKNVEAAIRASNARSVDVSSGVEQSPGVKDLNKIKCFIETVAKIKI